MPYTIYNGGHLFSVEICHRINLAPITDQITVIWFTKRRKRRLEREWRKDNSAINRSRYGAVFQPSRGICKNQTPQ